MSWFRLWEIQPLVIMELEQSEKHRGASLWTCHARAESSQSSAPSLSSPRHPGGVAVDIQAWAVVFLTEENASLSLCLFQSEELHRGAESFLPPSKILSCWSPWVYAPLALPGSNPILSFDPLLWHKEKLRPVEEVLLVKSLRWVCTALASGSKVQGPRKALACFVMSDAIREHFVLPLTFLFLKKNVVFKNSFIWLCWVLAAACKIFSCSIQTPGYGIQALICCMWGLFPWPGIEPGTPELGGWSLSHWTPRGVPHPATFHHHNSLLRKQSSSFLKPKSISVRSHTTLWVSFKNWG